MGWEFFMVHRKLASTAEHRASLLRNLVTNVLEHESITTTHAKAKEAQTAVERLITAAKHMHIKQGQLTKEQLQRHQQLLENRFFKQEQLTPKVMGELAARYANFNGGYTRILKLEPRLGDNAPQSILELVAGKRDMRLSMTAKAVARCAALGEPMNAQTQQNVKKLTRSSEMKLRFDEEVEAMRDMYYPDIKQGDAATPVSEQVRRKAPIKVVPNPLANQQ